MKKVSHDVLIHLRNSQAVQKTTFLQILTKNCGCIVSQTQHVRRETDDLKCTVLTEANLYKYLGRNGNEAKQRAAHPSHRFGGCRIQTSATFSFRQDEACL